MHNMGRATWIEHATFWTTIRRSNRLSYARHFWLAAGLQKTEVIIAKNRQFYKH
jgi:hypothetical protein